MSFIDPSSLARLSFTVNAGAQTLDIGVKAPFKLWLPDPSSAGSFVEKTITAPAQIKGDGHATENFNLGEAGQTLAVAWAKNYPLTWYITIESGNIYWVASRNPCMTQMPAAAANIGDFDAAPTTGTAQTNAFVAASITEADFVNLPVWPIGTLPVQRAAASAIPTLVALTAGRDGAGLWNDSTTWTFPRGQNGAVTDSYIEANATTEPTDATDTHFYRLDRSAMCNYFRVSSQMSGGSGATNAEIVLPFKAYGNYSRIVGGIYSMASSVGGWVVNSTDNTIFLWDSASAAFETNATIDDGAIGFSVTYAAYF